MASLPIPKRLASHRVVQWLECVIGGLVAGDPDDLGDRPERWFKELTDKQLRRGVFTNVPELIEAMTTWGAHWNDDPKPFICHATADDIIE
jgi:hypothetical protein